MTINTTPDSTSPNIAVRGPSPSITIAETTGSDNVVLQLLQDGLPLSSEGAEFRYESSTGNSYLRSGYSAGNLYLGAGSSSAAQVQLDSAGRLRMLFQPSFYVYGVPPVGASYNIIRLTTVEHNVGNHYNTSNGRFTAPITGRYFFGWYCLGNGPSDVYRYYLRRNGVEWEDLHVRAPSGIGYTGYYRAVTFALNAGDYVEIFFRSDGGNATYVGGGNSYHSFQGYLVG